MTPAPLFLNRDASFDWVIALPYGVACDGHPPDRFRAVSRSAAWFLEAPSGGVAGFVIHRLREADLEAPVHAELWEGPRFDASALALSAATAGEIAYAAQHRLRDGSTHNRVLFDTAVSLGRAPAAIEAWRQCLECGDVMAHYGLGYSLLEHDRPREAHAHLREYVRLCPRNAWAWCFLGRAAAAIGERRAAREALQRALALEAAGADRTDAAALLGAM